MVAATVVRRVTWPRTATSLETCQRSSAATATSMDTPAASARSPVTVSLVSPDLQPHMLTSPQILESSARTARSMATPRSAAPSLTLTRTAELVPTAAALILSTPLLTVVMVVETGTTTPVVVVGKLLVFLHRHIRPEGRLLRGLKLNDARAFYRSGISGHDG